jgi:type IV pilus assembly protein PilB
MDILVVEDDPISGLVLSTALEDLGHSVMIRGNGMEAWQLLQADTFDIVISDWMMPKMDGLDLCRHIRARGVSTYIYVILLTVKGTSEDRVEALNAGADDFLVKPLDPAELVGRLEVARRILAMKAELSGGFRHQNEQSTQISDVLVAQGVVTAVQIRTLIAEQGVSPHHIETALQARGWASEEDIARARAVVMDVPYVDVSQESLDPFTLALVTYDVAERHLLLPLSLTGEEGDPARRLRIAIADPYDIEAIDQVQRETRRRVEPFLASKSGILTALRRAYQDVQDVVHNAVMSDAIQQADVEQIIPQDEQDAVDPTTLLKQSDQAPVIRFVNTLFADAVYRRASDIHLEPGQKDFQIIYRIDGQLRPVRTVARSFLAPVISRIKIMSELDIVERRLPQDGHISLRIGDKSVDLRISTLPMQYGERLVIRILDRSSGCLQLDQLGLSESNQRTLKGLIQKPHGIVLVTGPTGSGKTTTLYAALGQLVPSASHVRQRRNIITCEDPIEYQFPGISQSNVNERTGLTFARQLRAILRQDPDVVLIGEIRDGETADIAFRAALTGHLVLSTLHCNEAAGAVSRLLDLGVAPYLIASSLAGVVAQRLVPRLCLRCRRGYTPSAEQAAFFSAPPERLYEPQGCVECDGLGVRGRIAVHEVLTTNDQIEALIMNKVDTPSIRSGAIEGGMRSMFEDGLEKVAQGLVCLDDVVLKTGAAAV